MLYTNIRKSIFICVSNYNIKKRSLSFDVSDKINSTITNIILLLVLKKTSASTVPKEIKQHIFKLQVTSIKQNIAIGTLCKSKKNIVFPENQAKIVKIINAATICSSFFMAKSTDSDSYNFIYA